MGISLLKIFIFSVALKVCFSDASACLLAQDLFRALGPLPRNINYEIPYLIEKSLADKKLIKIYDLNEAYKIGRYFGITIAQNFRGRHVREQLFTLNVIFNQISNLPAGLIQKIKNQVIIELVANDITESVTFQEYYGQKFEYDIQSGQPYIRLYQELEGCALGKCVAVASKCINRDSGRNVLLHELGHAVDAIYDYISDTSKYNQIHKKTGFVDSYLTGSPQETFAEGFAYFFESVDTRKKLKQIDPRLHDFIFNNIYWPNLAMN